MAVPEEVMAPAVPDNQDIRDADDDVDSRDCGTARGAGAATAPARNRSRLRLSVRWTRVLAYGLLPTLAMVLAVGAGYLKWQDASACDTREHETQSVRAATDGTVALLSYRPDTVEKDLGAARDLLTGDFKDSYTALTRDVVIPGAKQKNISAVAKVAAAAPVSATEKHAEVLVFVDQTLTIGADAPTDTASSIKVTLNRVGGRWLIAGFDPI
jgi:Mce-associated membrane protein